jgi:class 3 adenylate cyclase/tetratricopeptide (TPR) repeat protein/regulation of enolase protein 1 (concanavalin A-like superfamily)
MFVDISGSTKLSTEHSSEYIFNLTQDFFKRIDGVIYKYGGFVSGRRGDGLLALFGTPKLHEDDAERAIRAAIEIREMMQKQNIPVHFGINTAIMTVGDIQTNMYDEHSAYGAGINMAARLRDAGKPGQILVGENTYRLTRKAFVFKAFPSLTFYGFSQPVTPYAVQRVKIHPEKIRGLEGLKAGLIGRDRELNQLKNCIDDLLSGKGQIVSIIGEAGVGKSRLAAELKQYMEGKDIRLLEGRCDSIEESKVYSIFIDILRNYLELTDEDDPESMAKKVANNIQLLFPKKWRDVVPHIGHLLSVKFNGELDKIVNYPPPERTAYQVDQLKNQISLSLRDFFISLTDEKPLIIILDDLNWADDASLDLISLLIDELSDSPLMLVCIYRLDREHKSWHIGFHASVKYPDKYKEIILQDLTLEKSSKLLESLIHIDYFPKQVKNKILSKAGGNPYFIEEIVRSLIDSGIIYKEDEKKWLVKAEVDEITVPNTVHAILLARIDQLDEDTQKILKCASVIGTIFRSKLIQYSLQRSDLDKYFWQLEEKEMIYKERPIPEPEYSFRHVFIRDVLYNNMLTYERRALHQKVGEGIEHLYQTRLEEFYEELALHYTQSKILPKAIDYSIKAGDKAQVMNAYNEAVKHYEKALDFIQSPSTEIKQKSWEMDARQGLGDINFIRGVHFDAEIHLKRALDLAYEINNTQRIVSLNCRLADLSHWQGDFDGAIEIAESGLRALDKHISPEAVDLMEVICRSYRAKMDYEPARIYASKIAKIIREVPYFDSVYKAYYEIAWLQIQALDFIKADNWLKNMEQICLKHNNQMGLARCYHGMGDMSRARKDFRQAIKWMERSLSYCEQVGNAHLLMENHLELAYFMICLDEDPNKIEEHINKGMELAEKMAGILPLASATDLCRMLGNAYFDKGNIEKAIVYYRRAIEFGPPVSYLCYMLCRLEQFYAHIDRHEAFFEFCEQTKQREAFQFRSSLRYWHLQDALPSESFPQIKWQALFDSSTIPSEWQWIDPHGKSSYEITSPGILELKTPLWNRTPLSNSDCPRLLRDISGDFAVEVKIVGITDGGCQIGGLLIWASESNFLSFGKGNNRGFEFNELYLKDQDDIIGRGWLPFEELNLRIERSGNLVSSLCSIRGEKWKRCGVVDFLAEDPIQVGIYVGFPVKDTKSFLRFTDFKLYQSGVMT